MLNAHKPDELNDKICPFIRHMPNTHVGKVYVHAACQGPKCTVWQWVNDKKTHGYCGMITNPPEQSNGRQRSKTSSRSTR
jgi:hypothetical protein